MTADSVVLLVDDQRIVAEVIGAILDKTPGFHLESCQDPVHAIEHALRLHPTVILLDLVMPGVDGMTMLRFFKSHPQLARIPVIMLSAREDPDGKAKAFDHGATDYLVKLPHAVELTARLRYHSQAYRSQLERDAVTVALQDSQQSLEASNQQLMEVINSLMEAQQQEDRLTRLQELILGSAHDGIFSINSVGHCTVINPAALHMIGWAAESLTERHIHNVLHAESDHATEECPLLRNFATTSEDWFCTATGTRIPVEYSAAPILEEGYLDGVVVVFRDVTVRDELARMQNEFISTVSHELRTPLTSIAGCLGLVDEGLFGELAPKGQRLLKLAVQNTHRLVRLVSDVLDIERLRAGRMPLERSAFNVRQLARTALQELSPMATEHGVTLIADAVDSDVSADADRVLQVLTNLLSNAVKFSPTESCVSLSIAPHDGVMLFQVADQGRGIPGDRLDLVFERFQQVDASDARDHKGTGLGLAICRAIVEQHGGRIWVESAPSEGSTFYFTLPL